MSVSSKFNQGGIYIHIPFCSHKCIYCDFYTAGKRIADWDAYISALENEFTIRKSEINFSPVTLYIGGGTPSIIPEKHFKRLIKIIENKSGVSGWREFTLEVNPEDVTLERIKLWKDNQVNRISIGIQSLNDNELKIIGRTHSSKLALRALDLLKSNFDNVSADIIFGLPQQTSSIYSDSLRGICEAAPDHISSYSLMLEEGTAMTHLVNNERLKLPSEPEWIEMFGLTKDILEEYGYKRYEISNFCLPGKESIHNFSYWEGLPYLGIGPSAHSYNGENIRRANAPDIKGYLSHFKSATPTTPFYSEEILGNKELREEMIMTRLRTVKGLSIDEFGENFGKTETNSLLKTVSIFIKQGYMCSKDNFISFTDKGFLISDTLLCDLI